MHALARLVEDVMATNGWNQSEVGRRSGLTRSRVAQMINDPVRAVPTRDTITKLGRGLGVPGWVVLDAFLESLGLPRRPSYLSVEEALAADTTLTAADRRAVLGFLAHIRSETDQTVGRPRLTAVASDAAGEGGSDEDLAEGQEVARRVRSGEEPQQ